MIDPLWLVRMSRWARRRPSWRVFLVVLTAALLSAAVYGVELIWGWPEALTPERVPRRGPVNIQTTG